jgi:putative nucleotidyltransferase with HDIG domain
VRLVVRQSIWNPTFPLRNSTDVNKLQASGVRELWIDTSKGCDVESPVQDEDEANAAAPVQDPVPSPPAFAFVPQAPASMQDEARATKILKKTRDAVGVMFEDARMGRMASAQAAMPLVEEIASSVMRNSGALVSLVRLKQADDYTYMHSVAVCAMMIALARQLELSDEEVRDYGLAGLLHDIGKMAIPAAILNKPGRLTDEEFLTVKRHPSAGYDMLKTVEGMPEIVLDVCLHHHERMDGMGYPDQLATQTLSQAARVGAICDVYDAITSTGRTSKAGARPSPCARWPPGPRKATSTKNCLPPSSSASAFIRSAPGAPQIQPARRGDRQQQVAAQTNGARVLFDYVHGLSGADHDRPEPSRHHGGDCRLGRSAHLENPQSGQLLDG